MQFTQPIYPTLTLVRMLLSGNRQLCKAFESKVQTPANEAYYDPVRIYCPNVPNKMNEYCTMQRGIDNDRR